MFQSAESHRSSSAWFGKVGLVSHRDLRDGFFWRGVMATCPIIHQSSVGLRFRPIVPLLFWAGVGFT